MSIVGFGPHDVVSLSPALGANPALVSSVCAWLHVAAKFVQRRCLVLEASAAVTARGAVAFVGGPCSGKSSLALTLSLLGLPLLADGVMAIDLQQPNVGLVLPTPQPVEVSQDVLDALAIPLDRVVRVRDGVPRYRIHELAYAEQTTALHAVFLLGRTRLPHPELVEVTGHKRVLSLAEHSLNRVFDEDPGTRQSMLMAATCVLSDLPVHRLLLPERSLPLAAAAALACEACGLG